MHRHGVCFHQTNPAVQIYLGKSSRIKMFTKQLGQLKWRMKTADSIVGVSVLEFPLKTFITIIPQHGCFQIQTKGLYPVWWLSVRNQDLESTEDQDVISGTFGRSALCHETSCENWEMTFKMALHPGFPLIDWVIPNTMLQKSAVC